MFENRFNHLYNPIMSSKCIGKLILILTFIMYFIQRVFTVSYNFYAIFLIFFLPGFMVYLIVRKKPILSELLCFSPVLSCIIANCFVFLLNWYIHIPFQLSCLIYYYFIFIAAGMYSLFYTDKKIVYAKKEIFIFIIFFLASLILLFPAHSTRLQLSFDGILYTSLSDQIKNGFIPPSHHAMFDRTVNTYWLFPFYMSIVSVLLNASTMVINSLLWPVFLFLLLMSGYMISRFFTKDRLLLITSSFTIVFGLSIHNIFIWVPRVIKHPDWFAKIPTTPAHEIAGWVSYYWRDGRLTEFVNKIINYHGFIYGFIFFMMIIYLFLRIFIDMDETYNDVLFLSILILGLFLFHPTTLYLLVLIIPLFFVSFFFYKKRLRKTYWKLFGLFILGIFVSSIITFPYLYPAIMAMRYPKLQMYYNWVSGNGVFFSFLLLWPLIIKGLRNSLKKIFLYQYFVSIFLVCGLTLMSLFFNLPDANQYKFIFLLTIPLVLIIIEAYKKWRKLAKIILVLCFVQYIFILEIYINSAPGRDRELQNRNQEIVLEEHNPYYKGFEWIKKNTAVTSLVAVLPQYEYVTILTQRRPYITKSDPLYVTGYDSYTKRINNFNLLIDNDYNSSKIIDQIKSDIGSNKLFIILLKDKLKEPEKLVRAILQESKIRLVYQDPSMAIIRMN
jgi:hypothetical protein